MTVAFTYVAAETPPAPYALVSIGRSDGAVPATEVPAKVDSGASRTVVPAALAEQLNLEVVDRREFEGLGGQRVTLAIVRLLLTIRGCPTQELDAACSDGELFILLGRDVLNRYKIVLDGPNGRLEIG